LLRSLPRTSAEAPRPPKVSSFTAGETVTLPLNIKDLNRNHRLSKNL